jgi:hypothetical protein
MGRITSIYLMTFIERIARFVERRRFTVGCGIIVISSLVWLLYRFSVNVTFSDGG